MTIFGDRDVGMLHWSTWDIVMLDIQNGQNFFLLACIEWEWNLGYFFWTIQGMSYSDVFFIYGDGNLFTFSWQFLGFNVHSNRFCFK